MLRNSLRFRIISAFCLFCIISGTTYTAFVIFSLASSEDAVFNNRVALEIDDFLNRYSEDKNAALPNSAYIKGYIGKASLHEDLLILVKNKPDSVFEQQERDFHVGIAALPDTKEKLYIFYNTAKLEVHEEQMIKFGTAMLISIFFFLVLAILFSFFVADRVIQPVIQLADIIKTSNTSGTCNGFSNEFYHDEIGFLAQTLEQYLIQTEKTIKAEKRFASDVSHELRTPVTSIKGAVDVIQRNDPAILSIIKRPLGRIERAVKDMENLIETFLTLSRGKAHLPDEESFEVLPVIHEIIEQNRYLLNQKKVDIKIESENEVYITATKIYFKIIIGNLLRNAFQYIREGNITVGMDNYRITISDTGAGMLHTDASKQDLSPGICHPGHGIGIGLSIVQRLCDKVGWHLNIRSFENQGTTVSLDIQRFSYRYPTS